MKKKWRILTRTEMETEEPSIKFRLLRSMTLTLSRQNYYSRNKSRIHLVNKLYLTLVSH